VLWRLAARLLTGPVAFLLAGIVDLGAFAAITLRDTARKRLRSCLHTRERT
jgi:hypothetical protein